jgi:hypothetical protein
MKLPLSIFVVALVTTACASAASAHVVMVTAAIPAVSVSNDSDLEQALAVVLDDAITHTVAFAPTQITLQAMRRVGDQLYLLLLIVDADGEQLLHRLERDDPASSRSPSDTSENPAPPTM